MVLSRFQGPRIVSVTGGGGENCRGKVWDLSGEVEVAIAQVSSSFPQYVGKGH